MKSVKFFATLVLALVLLVSAFSASAAGPNARVRVAHFTVDAPAVDVFVNGSAVLTGVPFPAVSDYLEVPGGTYSIAVAPAGAGIEAAVIGPVDIEFAAGGSYLVAAIGQLADGSFQPFVINESSFYNAANANVLVLHGISDAGAVDIALADGTVLYSGLEFNNYAGLSVPAGEYPIVVTASDNFEATIFSDLNPVALEAGKLYLAAAIGSVGAGNFQLYVQGMDIPTYPSIAEIAAGNSDFSTLVAAADAAGLVETLAGPGPFTVFAPTNAAFEAALGDLGIAAADLLANTDLLTSILLYHVVPGEAYASDVIGLDSVATAQGGSISIAVVDGGVVLNGSVNVVATDIVANNGVIHVIDYVLLP